ncbi:MAG: MCE family protein [Deltaproteobacteria bacterium]|nr:MCE family protein [Deltaproteobacteria bacterium]
MKRWRAPLLVGLAGVGAVVVFVLLFGTVRKAVVPEGSGYRVFADFDDVSGLAGHSRVTTSGIPIGTIETVKLATGPGGVTKARVTIRVKDGVTLHQGVPLPDGTARNGATITRRTTTMLGDYYLEISPGFEGAILGEGDEIRNVVGESGIMALASKLERATDIFPRIQKIADDVGVITGSVSAVLGGPEGQARLERIAIDAQRAAGDIAKMTDSVRRFVDMELGAGGGRIGRIIANVDRFSSDAARFSRSSSDSLSAAVRNVEVITGQLREMLADDPSGAGTKAKIQTTLDNLTEATTRLAGITAKIDSGQGAIGRLVNDDTVVRKTEEVVSDVGGLVKSVTRLQTEVGFRTEYNIHSRAVKNYFSLRFEPSRDKYYLIELVFDPRGRTSVTDRTVLTSDTNRPPEYFERVTETSDAIKFSLEFAKRWDPFPDVFALTGRFGLIESTGGLGLDLAFLKDSLRFGFDLFDFNADRYPRLKFLWSWEFFKHFYVAAGVDDIANDRRDYFAGAGIRLTDNDLKALLMVAPTPSL